MASRAARRGGRRPGALLAAAVLAALAVLAAGCATVPSSGRVQQAQNNAAQNEAYPQSIPVAPQPGWLPKEIVQGFLQASASGFVNDHAAARQYLTSGLRPVWKPTWAVTVVSGDLSEIYTRRPQHNPDGTLGAQVQVTGQHLATLTATGQYQVSSATTSYSFNLVLNNSSHIWQISGLPSCSKKLHARHWSCHLLLLTKPDFVNVYQAHDLYFARPASQVLVPDPVFLPQTGTPQQLARVLVKALLAAPRGLLTGAAVTKFPPGATLLTRHAVAINGSVLTVNLGGAAARASRSTLDAMAAQLVYTLAVPSGSAPPIAQSVVLKINGKTQQHLYPQPYQSAGYLKWLTDWQPPPPVKLLYFLRGSRAYVQSSGAPRPVPGPAGAGQYPLSALAATPRATALAGIGTVRTRRGKAQCAVWTGLGAPGGRVATRHLPAPCTSVGYSTDGELWVVASGGLYLLPAGTAAPVPVAIDGLGTTQSITALRVAPDGVRVAMIVRNGNGTTQVDVGSIEHAPTGPSIAQTVTVADNVPDPWQLSWYGSDDILVLSRSGSRLWEAPVNGGEASQINPEQNMTWLTSNGRSLAVASGGDVLTSGGPNSEWRPAGPGSQPAVPGG